MHVASPTSARSAARGSLSFFPLSFELAFSNLLVMQTGGDDLDDDFVVDDLVALSGDEDGDVEELEPTHSETQDDVPDVVSADEEAADSTAQTSKAKKRKRREKER